MTMSVWMIMTAAPAGALLATLSWCCAVLQDRDEKPIDPDREGGDVPRSQRRRTPRRPDR